MATKKKTETATVNEAMPAVVTVKVVKTFKDKETGEIHKPGEKLTITVARKEEILKKGAFVE